MSSSDPFPLVFDRAVVSSGQRLRLISSRRPLFILAVVVLFSLATIWEQLLPWLRGETPVPPELIATLWGLGLAGLVLVVMFVLVPLVDPLVNRWWQRKYRLALLPDALRMIGPDGASYDVPWEKVRRVLRNQRALVVVFGNERRDFIILPRASLQQYGREALLDQYIEAAKAKSKA
jgi:hypothetical protein